MKINWKIRIMNKSWLLIAIPVIVSAVYNILALFGIVPTIAQDNVQQWLVTIVNMLAALGAITDPTQAVPLKDSTRAMGYTEPYKEEKSNG